MKLRTKKYYEELVERDKPLMVEYEADGYSDEELVYDSAYCPVCRHYFEVDFDDDTKFCPDCGQRLKWK